ncbi:protein CURVATURE THYLAKOID 1D, chloroplastic isoform X1 [Vitis vinifera]|uniref:protein CURVATURE THYLAKOID 1D, chloroplastic isoform X1 n=1 Tax=Vitis vinifera TaxID=29760 RepID=UPI0028834288|nr:protein CURVATURE THYLAKOID 1D, chloroplastic isoform X1 [Vitis vinifera]
MELCTTRAFSNLHHRTLFNPLANRLRWKTISIPFKQSPISRTSPGSLYFNNPLLRASISEGSSSGADQYFGEERDSVLVMEDIPATEENVYNEVIPTEAPIEDSQVEEQTVAFEFLDNLNIKFDSEDPYSIFLYGTGALTALWFASAIVGAIDSIPIFPKLMEIVGLGYTLWFSARYLIFKVYIHMPLILLYQVAFLIQESTNTCSITAK